MAAGASGGAPKFLEELLEWRELSYSWASQALLATHDFCDPKAILPKWSCDTLLAHERDARPDLKDLAAMEGAATGDVYWDAMQGQLNAHGELHNNLRMTWVRQFPKWCATVREGMAVAQYLNDKYALDGCDPCSHAGVLWGFGLFETPKAKSDTPIYGRVAQRRTSGIASRRQFNLQQYKHLPIAGNNGRFVPQQLIGAEGDGHDSGASDEDTMDDGAERQSERESD